MKSYQWKQTSIWVVALLFGIIIFLPFNSTQAQEDEAFYSVVNFMKVKPGMGDAYLDLETKIWKKFHESRKKSGKIVNWMLFQVLSPSGSSVEYNYITVDVYKGAAGLASHYEWDPAAMEGILTDEEMKKAMKTDEVRELVKSEVFRRRDAIWTEKEGATGIIQVANYMKFKEGVNGPEYKKVEDEIWKPVHEARVNDGGMTGWAVQSLELPYGSALPYDAVTVDVYETFEDMMAPFFDTYFPKVHPGKDVDDLLDKTGETHDLIKSDVLRRLDSLN